MYPQVNSYGVPMPWDETVQSVRRTVEAVEVPERGGLVGALARWSAVAGLVLGLMFIPAVAFGGYTVNRLSNALGELPAVLEDAPAAQTTKVVAADGSQLAYFYKENRQDVPLGKIHSNMQQAILAIEDNRFYSHGAIDLKGTVRAVLNNATSDSTQGGSSITQQLMKLMLVQHAATQQEIEAATAPSIARKLRELKLAAEYEETHTKDQILERYLNLAYYGDGAYGINAAASHWFSTSPDQLDVKQAATLAGLVRNPSYLDPNRFPDRALERRNTVLAVMAQQGKIDEAEAERLAQEPLGLKITAYANGCASAASGGSFACDYVRRYLLQEPALGPTLEDRRAILERGGLTIESSIDPRMQKAVFDAVTSTVDPKDRAIGSLALLEPGTGKVRGVAQSRPMGADTGEGQSYINFAVPTAYGDSGGFPAGSTFKLFTTAAALKKGIPVKKRYKAPKRMTIPGGSFRACNGGRVVDDWEVKNSTDSGTMNMYTGLRKSVNTYYAQLERDAGLCETVRMAEGMGIYVPEQDQVGPFTLGVTSVSPLTMAAAYAVPASGGMYCKPQPVDRIRDMHGTVIKEYTKQCTRVLDTGTAAQINDILTGLQQPGGFGHANGTGLKIPSAAKTGTTQDNKAVWYMGYTPSLVAASMIAGAGEDGRPRSLVGTTLRGAPMAFNQVGGSSLAGPMWKKAMGVIQDYLQPTAFSTPPEPAPGSGGDGEEEDDADDPADDDGLDIPGLDLPEPDDYDPPDPGDFGPGPGNGNGNGNGWGRR
jgi:membrane peptidoglycan carboxypeptidase